MPFVTVVFVPPVQLDPLPPTVIERTVVDVLTSDAPSTGEASNIAALELEGWTVKDEVLEVTRYPLESVTATAIEKVPKDVGVHENEAWLTDVHPGGRPLHE